VLKTSVAILASVFLSAGCSDDMTLGDQVAGADAGIAGTIDAAPTRPDASPPSPDAEPDTTELPIELACTLEELQPVIECVTENCADSFADGSILTCVTFSCGLLLLGLPPDCSQCLFAGLSDPSSALDACVLGLDDLGGGFPMPPAP
jgi:hypothetical protein